MDEQQVIIHDYERIDDLHRNGLKLIQDPKRFCFGIDAVLLSDFATVNAGETALDLGTGTGVIPILLTAKSQGNAFIGLDIQPESVDMARRSVALNNLTRQVDIIEGDIKHLGALFKPSSFDVITTNPPYMNAGGGLLNVDSPRAIARHEILCTLGDIVSGAAGLLRPNGRFYMVHRPHRLIDAVTALRNHKLEPKTLRLVHPFVDKEPTMALIEAVRGGRPFLHVCPPLVIYKTDRSYTEEIYRIYYE